MSCLCSPRRRRSTLFSRSVALLSMQTTRLCSRQHLRSYCCFLQARAAVRSHTCRKHSSVALLSEQCGNLSIRPLHGSTCTRLLLLLSSSCLMSPFILFLHLFLTHVSAHRVEPRARVVVPLKAESKVASFIRLNPGACVSTCLCPCGCVC